MAQLLRDVSGGLVAATFDGLTLVLRQSEVKAIEQSDFAARYRGVIHHLSRTLEPVHTAPRSFFLVIHSAAGEYCLSCDEVSVVPGTNLELQPLPLAMRGPRSPFYAFARHRDGLAFLGSADALAEVVNNPAVHHHAC